MIMRPKRVLYTAEQIDNMRKLVDTFIIPYVKTPITKDTYDYWHIDRCRLECTEEDGFSLIIVATCNDTEAVFNHPKSLRPELRNKIISIFTKIGIAVNINYIGCDPDFETKVYHYMVRTHICFEELLRSLGVSIKE